MSSTRNGQADSQMSLAARMAPLMRPAVAYRLAGWLFLRGLALIYLAAFASMVVQITALAGEQGIYPIAEQLAAAQERYGGAALWHYPSLFWLASGDWALIAVAWGGCALALLLLLGVRERLSLILLYLGYLSLYHAGQVFTSFQWDYLLLETGFLAVFLPGGSRLIIWLLRWVLFKLRFLSGLAKLISGDPQWGGLTALSHYFETQPLPHIGAWYAHQLPDWVLKTGTAGTLFVELIVPFFLFLPRRWRLFAAWVTILWQLLIIATSNHNWLNLLTILLCLLLFDDRAIARIVPSGLVTRIRGESSVGAQTSRPVAMATLVAALVVVPAGIISATEMIRGRTIPMLSGWNDRVEPFRIANRYHVFPTMDTERIAVQVEVSRDGADWVPLNFRYAPDDPAAAPQFVVPHQPRLDWLLWFVPRGPVFLDWFGRFLEQVLAGSPTLTALLQRPPLEDGTPSQARVRVYRYRFTTPEERDASGNWWVREDLGPFHPLPWIHRDGDG
jgi:hypothetical protein